MKINSKLYLRGHKEPILISEAGAKKLQEMFLDDNVHAYQPMSAGRVAFKKEEIKSIDILRDTEEYDQNSPKKPVWVIFSKTRRSIWQQPYDTYQAAKAELEFQAINMTDEELKKMDWVIENWGGNPNSYTSSLQKSAQ